MTDVVVQDKDVIVPVPQPTVPPAAIPPKIGLVEINQVVQRGSAWMTGHGAPTLPGGQYGDMYLDVDTGDIYIWDGAAWDYTGTFAPSTLTPEEILAALITVDGAGSNLDADLLDGQHGAYYAKQTDMTTETTRNDNQDAQIATNASNITFVSDSVTALDASKAPKDSPVFIGDPKAPTPAPGDNDTSIATTAFVAAALTAGTTPAQILAKLLTVDGAGSALDADLLDGQHGAFYQSLLNATGILPAANFNDASHGNRAGGTLHATATPTVQGFMVDAPSDGLGYMRKNGVWTPSTGGAATDDLPPAGPLQDGQLWWKSSTGVLYLWYDDGNSQQWVQVSASPQVAMGDLKGVTSINGGQLAGFRNLLVNPRFVIIQMPGGSYSTTLAANAHYVADYWKAGPAGCTLTGVGQITAGNLLQIVDAADLVAGQTYCINWVGTAPCTINGVAKNKGDTYVHSSGNVTISWGVGTLQNPQFEPGNVPTPFEVRSAGIEMALCKYRYEVSEVVAGGYQGVGGVNFAGLFPYSQKRAVPTVSTPLIITSSNVQSASFTNVSLGSGATYSVVGTGTGAATVLAVAYAQADARL